MSSEYVEAHTNFESDVVNNVLDSNLVPFNTASEWFDAHPSECEAAWVAYLEQEGLDALITISEIEELGTQGLFYLLERECYESIVNGNRKQFKQQYKKLNPKSFVEFMEQYVEFEQMVVTLKYIVKEVD